MQNTELDLLKMIADIDGIPSGAHNIRANGETGSRVVTENVDIVTKTDKPGIDIIIKAGTKGESVHKIATEIRSVEQRNKGEINSSFILCGRKHFLLGPPCSNTLPTHAHFLAV